MADTNADRIETLWAFEEIRQLKHRYFRAVDTKDWTLLESTLAADCSFAFGDGERHFSSRSEFMDFQRRSLSSADIVSMHVGFQPELELDGADSAHGRWALYSEVRIPAVTTCMRQFAFYEDRYRREEGAWLIASTAYKRVFNESDANQSVQEFSLGSLLAHAQKSG